MVGKWAEVAVKVIRQRRARRRDGNGSAHTQGKLKETKIIEGITSITLIPEVAASLFTWKLGPIYE